MNENGQIPNNPQEQRPMFNVQQQSAQPQVPQQPMAPVQQESAIPAAPAVPATPQQPQAPQSMPQQTMQPQPQVPQQQMSPQYQQPAPQQYQQSAPQQYQQPPTQAPMQQPMQPPMQQQPSMQQPQQPSKKSNGNPKLKKIIILVASIVIGIILIGTAIGVASCVIDGLPKSGDQTYQKQLSSDITGSTKYGDVVIKYLNKAYPETQGNIKIVKKEREDVYTYSSFESISASYELEDEYGTAFRASYNKQHDFATSYRGERVEESISENYYGVSYNKAMSKEITTKLKEEFGQEINFVIGGGYYSISSSGNGNTSAPSKEEYFSSGTGFTGYVFTGIKTIDLEKVGKVIYDTAKIKDDSTRVMVAFAGKMNYKEMDSACGVDTEMLTQDLENKEAVPMGTLDIKRNGTINVTTYDYL